MGEGTGAAEAVRPVDASEAAGAGENYTGVIRRGTEAHSIDGDAVVAFCEDRIGRMRSPVTRAIYAGMADRVRRGFFDERGEGDVY